MQRWLDTEQNDSSLQNSIMYWNSTKEVQQGIMIIMHERHNHTLFMHHRREIYEESGRDEDSPATIYLIWLSWLHNQRPVLLEAKAGGERVRDEGFTGRHSPAQRLFSLTLAIN